MNPYFEQTIVNADPVELVRIVYKRVISCVRAAREHLKDKKIAERSAAIMGAYAALAELVAALRPAVAPELCERLRNLYQYMQQRLIDANTQQSDPPLAEVLGLLTTLEEAWAGVADALAVDALAVNAEEAAMAVQADPRPEIEIPPNRWSGAGRPYGTAGQVGISA